MLVLFIPLLLDLTGVPFYQEASYSDLLIAHLPNARFIGNALVEWGQIPLWNPTILAGAPFAADPLSGMAYLPTWAAVILPAPVTFNLLIMLHMVWAGFGCLTLARKDGRAGISGVIFALAFAGTPKLFAHLGLGHISLVFAVSWTPWLLVLIFEMIATLSKARELVRYAVLAGAVLGLIFLADPRWSLPSLILALGYTLHRWLHLPGSSLRQIHQLVRPGLLAAGSAGGIAALLALPLWEYLQLSTRADLAEQASNTLALEWSHLLGFFQPFLAQAEQVVYMGVAVLVLAAIGLQSRKPGSVFWSGVFVIAVVFSLGSRTAFFTLITQWLPGAGFLRVPTRSLFLAALAIAALAGQGLESLLTSPKNSKQSLRIRRLSLVIFAFILVFNLGLAVLQMGSIVHQLTTVGVTIAAAMLVELSLRGRLSVRFSGQLWLILILFDLARVNWTMIQVKPYPAIQAQRDMIAESLARPYGEARSFSPSYAIPQLTATSRKLELADGVNPLQLSAYYGYLHRAVGFEIQEYGVALPPFPSGDPARAWDVSIDAELLGRLNVDTVVSDYPLEDGNLVLIESVDGANIYELQGARPRAWVTTPDELSWVPADIIRWSPNRIQVRAQGPGRLVLSEIDYPGWQVVVDHQPAELQVSNGLLRSVMIPQGQHEVTFSFHPQTVYWGLAIFMITLLFGGYLVWRR
jgi:hypothetical protein